MTDVAYIAVDRLIWGDGHIEPGQPVPVEEGRNYAGLLRLGKIARTQAMSDDQMAATLIDLTAERDTLKARVAELEADEEVPPVEIPEGVVPGETPGWPLVVLPFTDEQRELLVGAGISGTFTADELAAKLAELRADVAGDADGDAGSQAAEDGDEADAATGNQPGDGLPSGVRALGGGWFELPDETRVRGRKALNEALAKAKEEAA